MKLLYKNYCLSLQAKGLSCIATPVRKLSEMPNIGRHAKNSTTLRLTEDHILRKTDLTLGNCLPSMK